MIITIDSGQMKVAQITCDGSNIAAIANTISYYEGRVDYLEKRLDSLNNIYEEAQELRDELESCKKEIAFKDSVFEVLQNGPDSTEQSRLALQHDIQEAFRTVQEIGGCNIDCAVDQSL
jgi:chromosome segregation ATPase